ncbi:hypothetical protein P4S72_23830 [Vibrio sp. PP-XX7]
MVLIPVIGREGIFAGILSGFAFAFLNIPGKRVFAFNGTWHGFAF